MTRVTDIAVYNAIKIESNSIKKLQNSIQQHQDNISEISQRYENSSSFHDLVGQRLVLTEYEPNDEAKAELWKDTVKSIWGYAPIEKALEFIKQGKLVAKKHTALDIKATMIGNSFEVTTVKFEDFGSSDNYIEAHWTLYTKMLRKDGKLSEQLYRFRFIDLIQKDS